MIELKKYSLVYLATPYTKYPTGIEMAFRDTAALTAKLMTAGVPVYSPICHGHPLSLYGGVEPLSHEIWLSYDATMMSKCDALVIAKMVSWEQSFGIAEEAKHFRAANKPIYELDPVTLTVEQHRDEECRSWRRSA